MAAIPLKVFRHIRRIQFAANRLAEDFMVGAYCSAFKGRGREFEEVREYTMGDDVRDIDWNVTARTNHPYVKVFREERRLTVIFMVDISASLKFGTVEQLKSELIAEICALLAFTAIKNNDDVGLLLYSDIVEKYVPPKRGVRHVLRVIRDLLVFKRKRPRSNLKAALDFLGNVQKKSCVCFLLSDFLYPLQKRELAIASKHHDLISIHLLDPAEEAFPDVGLVRMRDLETGREEIIDTSDEAVQKQQRSTALEIKKNVKKIMGQIKAGYILVKTDASYIPPIAQFFRMRRMKR